jgi:hypothetical protein
MNAKRARLFRKFARRRTIGQPDRAYVRTTAKTMWDDKGNPVVKESVTLARDCTRGVYQRMKAEHMAMRRS